MLKIYPSPFNKLVFFILYGLLSVAAITLAQEGPMSSCPLALPPSDQITIGYVQIENITDPKTTINWDYYTFINVIAYPFTPNTPWNDIHPPSGTQNMKQLNTTLINLVSNKKQAKILLSIRNFDLTAWPNDEDDYNTVTEEIGKIVKGLGLDGVDIEYPGMRGHNCKDINNPNPSLSILPIWDPSNDQNFVKFIKNVSESIGDNKTLMLTVGNNVINGLDYSLIDYLNIETYHYSFYENFGELLLSNERVKSNPNAPLNKYEDAYNQWVGKIDSKKIIMGIDLGNTFQILDQNITSNQIVETGIHDANEIADVTELPRINFCPGGPNSDKLKLYFFPWKRLIAEQFITLNNCQTVGVGGWDYHFDDDSGTSTSWLYKTTIPIPNPARHYYLSFEDFNSLNSKLKFSTSKSIGGISISDILYDDATFSLVNYIQGIRGSNPSGSNSTNGPSPPGSSTSPSNSDPSTNAPPNEGNRTGKIIGGVLGSVFGLVILGGILFVGYKHKDKLPFIQNKFGNEKMYHGTSYTNQPGMIPEGSPRMIIPETTAVPVAPSFVTAMFDFAGKEENDLSFKKGDKIEVLERGDGPNDWWVGRVNGAVGEFPGNYVKE